MTLSLPSTGPEVVLAEVARRMKEHFVAAGFVWDHPVYPLPTALQLAAGRTEAGARALEAFFTQRQQCIDLAKADPYRYGYEPPMWKRADELLAKHRKLLVSGTNRSSKSHWAAKRTVQKVAGTARRIAWCLCETEETSKRGTGQQEYVFNYLPAEWRVRSAKRGSSLYYDPKNKFASNALVAPNGSEIRFMNYRQPITVIEGGECDVIWADELLPIDFYRTLLTRLTDRRGEFICTFTPIYGWNETYGEFTELAEVTEWRPADLLPDQVLGRGWPRGTVPAVMENQLRRSATIFFDGRQNPFSNFEAVVAEWKDRGTEKILNRIYGVATRKAGNQFPKFGRHNIIRPEQVPTTGSRYHLVDFAWARPWAQIWVLVQNVRGRRRVVVYRDWPDHQQHGEWAVPSSKPNGDRGPAQMTLGYGIADYKRLILGLERVKNAAGEWVPEEIVERLGDPRSGRAAALSSEAGDTNILTMLSDDHGAEAPPMFVTPAHTDDIRHGINLINDWLAYDDTQPITPLNEPAFYVSENCQQVIDCLRLWTGQGRESEQASKDFIDLLRYAAMADLEEVTPGRYGSRGGGSY